MFILILFIIFVVSNLKQITMALPSKEELTKLYYEQEYSLEMIAKKYGKSIGSVNYWFRKYDIPRRSHKEANILRDKLLRRDYTFLFERSPAEHPNWKGGRRINCAGYVELRIPEHPRARKNGYVFEHLIVAEQHYGEITKDYVIHHINGNKQDNRIENLMVLTQKEHIEIIPNLVKENNELKQKVKKLEDEIKKLRDAI